MFGQYCFKCNVRILLDGDILKFEGRLRRRKPTKDCRTIKIGSRNRFVLRYYILNYYNNVCMNEEV